MLKVQCSTSNGERVNTLECGDLSPLCLGRDLARPFIDAHHRTYCGVKPPHNKALTGQRTPKSCHSSTPNPYTVGL
jgi:hypothetical protein